MRKNKRLEKAGITAERHMELRYFCKQYPQKKDELKELTHLSGVKYSDMPKGTRISNPTEERALKILSLKNDIEMIEKAAFEACGVEGSTLFNAIIENVTKGIEYSHLMTFCGKRYFYKMVENFYIILNTKKK